MMASTAAMIAPIGKLPVAHTPSQLAPAASVIATDVASGRSRTPQSLIVTSSGAARTRTCESRVGRMEEGIDQA
jgi:hypothetical protein